MIGILDDIQVLDFGRFIAGPYCGMLMADMGAEVVRVEPPGGADDRTTGLVGEHGENMLVPCYGRNKKAITLQVNGSEKGREIFHELVAKSDVIIHSFSPKAAQFLGFGYDELKKIRPDIIVVAISCYGSTGPYAERGGFDFTAQAISGCMALGGPESEPYTRAFMTPLDFSTGIMAAYAAMGAIRHRDKTGEGQLVDLSLLQTGVSFATLGISEAEVMQAPRPRIGNRVPYMGPSDLFECRDGYVFLAIIMSGLWDRLMTLIGHEELIDDPDLSSDLERYKQRDRVDPLVAEWCSQKTVEEVLLACAKNRIPCSPVYDLDQVSKDPHISENKMIHYLDSGEEAHGEIPVSAVPFKLSATPGEIRCRAPRVGEHNEEIYKKWLGYGDEKLKVLSADNII